MKVAESLVDRESAPSDEQESDPNVGPVPRAESISTILAELKLVHLTPNPNVAIKFHSIGSATVDSEENNSTAEATNGALVVAEPAERGAAVAAGAAVEDGASPEIREEGASASESAFSENSKEPAAAKTAGVATAGSDGGRYWGRR